VQYKVTAKSLRILGRNINRLRNEAGFSQDQLAVQAGLTKRYVQMLESGQKTASLATIRQLHESLDCSYDELLKDL
jgi:transcriptional regulator with XRE-family HTH domain